MICFLKGSEKKQFYIIPPQLSCFFYVFLHSCHNLVLTGYQCGTNYYNSCQIIVVFSHIFKLKKLLLSHTLIKKKKFCPKITQAPILNSSCCPFTSSGHQPPGHQDRDLLQLYTKTMCSDVLWSCSTAFQNKQNEKT